MQGWHRRRLRRQSKRRLMRRRQRLRKRWRCWEAVCCKNTCVVVRALIFLSGVDVDALGGLAFFSCVRSVWSDLANSTLNCFEIPRLPLTIPYTCILGGFHYHLLHLTGDGLTFFNSYARRRHGGSTNQRASAAANAHGAAHKSAFA